MRIGRVLLTVAFAAFFLLMLSALVVAAPQEGVPREEPAAPSRLNAQFLPMVPPTSELSADRTARPQHARLALLPVLALMALTHPVCFKRDANGRVLSARRYENSFYQLFRQEVAGG